jgi:hypothetical protein
VDRPLTECPRGGGQVSAGVPSAATGPTATACMMWPIPRWFENASELAVFAAPGVCAALPGWPN